MFELMAPSWIHRVKSSPSALAEPVGTHLKPPISEPQCGAPDRPRLIPARTMAGSPMALSNDALGSPDQNIGM